MEVWPLDGKDGDGAGSGLGGDAFPGNNLGKLEFTPEPALPVGGPRHDRRRAPPPRHDRRARDRRDRARRGKKRYALSLSIHGIERAGVEGGTRAMEDLVTAYTTLADGRRARSAGRARDGRPGRARRSPRCCKKTIIYFTYPEPGRLAARLGLDRRRLLPALQRQRRRPEPRLAGHRLLVPPLLRAVRAGEPRAGRLLRRRQGQGRRLRRGRRPARPAVRGRALLHAPPPRPAPLRQGHPHPRDGEDDPRELGGGAQLVADHPAERRAAGRRRAVRAGRRSARPARRSTGRPGGRSTTRSTTRRPARWATTSTRRSGSGRTASTTRCRSRTSTRTSRSTRTPSSCTWTATRR